MLSGIGSLELLTIGVVALIFIGPKDLPVVFLRVGQFVGRIRGMARDFQTAMSDVARQSGLDDVKTSLDGLGDLNKIGKTTPAGSKADTAKNFHNKYLKPLEADKKSKTGKAVKSAVKTASKPPAKTAVKTASHGGARTVPAKTVQPPAESSPSAKSAATAPKKPAVKPAKPVKQKSS